MSYDRRQINAVKGLSKEKKEKVSPKLYIGRDNDVLTTEEQFAVNFFNSCSDEGLKRIWETAEECSMEEILIIFFKERDDKVPSVLSEDEMKSFDFSSQSWTAKAQSNGWDELREVSEGHLSIIFF